MKILSTINGVHYLTAEVPKFSSLYIEVRKKEERVLSDKQVLNLPFITSKSPHHKEWKLRQPSTKRFLKYIKSKIEPLNIIEVGCGNGWFSNAMTSTLRNHKVIGLDISKEELEQAARLFKKESLQFVYGDLFCISEFEKQFDMVVLNASVQYFPAFKVLFSKLKTWLKCKGEIHILDSPFYDKKDLDKAKKRTENYYQSLGFEAMTNFYYHHSFDDLESFEILYQPRKSILSKWIKHESPFSWWCFYK